MEDIASFRVFARGALPHRNKLNAYNPAWISRGTFSESIAFPAGSPAPVLRLEEGDFMSGTAAGSRFPIRRRFPSSSAEDTSWQFHCEPVTLNLCGGDCIETKHRLLEKNLSYNYLNAITHFMALQTVKVIKQRRMGKAIRERDSLSFFFLSLSLSLCSVVFFKCFTGQSYVFFIFQFFSWGIPYDFLKNKSQIGGFSFFLRHHIQGTCHMLHIDQILS